jgi:hypothetical protein
MATFQAGLIEISQAAYRNARAYKSRRYTRGMERTSCPKSRHTSAIGSKPDERLKFRAVGAARSICDPAILLAPLIVVKRVNESSTKPDSVSKQLSLIQEDFEERAVDE